MKKSTLRKGICMVVFCSQSLIFYFLMLMSGRVPEMLIRSIIVRSPRKLACRLTCGFVERVDHAVYNYAVRRQARVAIGVAFVR